MGAKAIKLGSWLSMAFIAFYLPIGCVRFAMYCGKMYNRHLFPYSGLRAEVIILAIQSDTKSAMNQSELE